MNDLDLEWIIFELKLTLLIVSEFLFWMIIAILIKYLAKGLIKLCKESQKSS